MMMQRVEEFKDFVREHPGLKQVVREGKSTWQKLYEEWYLYGADDAQWKHYKAEKETEEKSESSSMEETAAKFDVTNGVEVMTQAFEYLQKMDIDKVQKTMGTVQQFIQIFQTMQGGKGAALGAAGALAAKSRPNYSGFFSQYDD